jgi:hypothetical protein
MHLNLPDQTMTLVDIAFKHFQNFPFIFYKCLIGVSKFHILPFTEKSIGF